MMTKKEKRDATAIAVIGVALGLLIQPIISNNLPSLMVDWNLRIGTFFLLLVFSLFALAVARLIEYAWHGIYQFAQFAAVGVLNSFIDIGIFNLETFFYGSVVGTGLFAVFKAISFLCATTNSFFWNRSWTFGAHRKDTPREVVSFYVIAGLGWILNVGVATLVKVLGPTGASADAHLWTNLVAPLVGIAASFLWNFFGYKYFVFKK